MSAMLREAVIGHPSALWATAMVVVFSALFSVLVLFVFKKKMKAVWNRASRLPLSEDES